jgi:C-terminal processing protease CtpA/Prc
MRPSRRFLASSSLLFLLVLTLPAAGAPPPPGVDRLARLAKLWGTVRYLHPYLAYKEIDWDGALVRAIPGVRAARTPAEYAATVQTMLAALGDPATRVQAVPQRSPLPPAGKPPAPFRWLDAGTLSVYLRPDADTGMDEAAFQAAMRSLSGELSKAKAVIVDIRGMGFPYPAEYVLHDLANALSSRPVEEPAQRYRLHSGFRDQVGPGYGGYYSGFEVRAVDRYAPPAGAAAKRVVFLVNGDTVLPPVTMALQAAGDGAIVSAGSLGEGAGARLRTVDLGEGWMALVRTTEIVPRPGWSGPRADAELPPDAGDSALEGAALRLLREAWPKSPAGSAAPLPDAVWRPDPSYDGMTEPTAEYRLLGVFKLWNVFHYFFPYLHLTGDWDAVLPEFIARMEQARDGREYALTLAEMAARANDGHVALSGNPTLDALYGRAPAPVAVRWIEDAWVVTELGEPAKTSGIEIGDVILTLDGEPVAKRDATLRRYYSASTEAGMRRKIADHLLSGEAGTELVLTVRGRGDQVREVRLKRQPWTPRPAGETVRVLPGNLGYADLTRLTVPEVEGMFERLKGTRAIVLDMRGYPNGTAWPITPYLNTRGATAGPLFRRRLLSGLDQGESSLDFTQRLPDAPVPRYPGRTVMLIDERTVSQAEHSGLFFEAANGTKFIGTPTAGADGDITFFSLPGIASVRFSGHDIRHPDGRQLQRIGLVPDVLVSPTIQGIREGRDEVLDRAVRYLNEELPAPPAAGAPAAPGGGSGSGGGSPSR